MAVMLLLYQNAWEDTLFLNKVLNQAQGFVNFADVWGGYSLRQAVTHIEVFFAFIDQDDIDNQPSKTLAKVDSAVKILNTIKRHPKKSEAQKQDAECPLKNLTFPSL